MSHLWHVTSSSPSSRLHRGPKAGRWSTVIYHIAMLDENALAPRAALRNTSHPIDILTRVQHTRSASLNGTRIDPSSHLLGTPLIRLSGFPTPFIDLLEQLGFVPRRPI
jgi:hypothetical protein